MNIIGISGSLRAGSFNSAALRAAAGLAPAGVTFDMADLAAIPLYNEDERARAMPAAVATLVAQIRAADAVMIATPEYNYSISGVLKNAIDWVSRADNQPFAGKPIAIIGASAGQLGTARAQYDLRKIFVFLDGHVMNKPEIMIGAAPTKFDANGTLTDEATRKFLAQAVQALCDWAKKLG
jgi:chromate reductase